MPFGPDSTSTPQSRREAERNRKRLAKIEELQRVPLGAFTVQELPVLLKLLGFKRCNFNELEDLSPQEAEIIQRKLEAFPASEQKKSGEGPNSG